MRKLFQFVLSALIVSHIASIGNAQSMNAFCDPILSQACALQSFSTERKSKPNFHLSQISDPLVKPDSQRQLTKAGREVAQIDPAVGRFIQQFHSSISQCWRLPKNAKKVTLIVKLDSAGKLVGRPALAHPAADKDYLRSAAAAIDAIVKCKLPARGDGGRLKELNEFEVDFDVKPVAHRPAR